MPRTLFQILFVIVLIAGANARTMAQELASNEIVTNDKVITMVQAGLPASVIINKIRNSKTSFDMSTDQLIRLKQARVPEDVLNTMIDPSAASSASATAPSANSPAKEIGVYLKQNNDWMEMQPEMVNWKTGGVGKSIATLGVVKQDVNGHLDGKNSRTQVNSPVEFMIVTPEGVAITEYLLIKLNQNSDDREFRTMTGGVFHAKGGATRDIVAFESQKVATRTFTITLNGTKAGEYGFLPPGALTQLSGAATLGKMYTFSVGTVK